jgi:ATP-binding cassette subfamily B protein
MKFKMLAKETLHLQSSLPGRKRWSVDGLRRQPLLAEQIEVKLSMKTGVTFVKANPLSGRVLVRFEETLLKTNVDILILEIIESITICQVDAEKKEDKSTKLSSINLHSEKPNKNIILALIRAVETQQQARSRWKAMGYSLLNNILSLTVPLSLGLIITIPLSGGLTFFTKLGLRNPVFQISLLGVVFFLSRMAESTIEYQCKKEWKQYASDIEHTLRVNTYAHIQHLDMADLENQSTGQLMNLIHYDPIKIRQFLETVPHSAIDKASSFVLGGIFLLFISPLAFFLALIPLPFLYGLYLRYHKTLSERYQIQSEREGYVNHLLANSLSGLPTIKSFTSEDYEQKRLAVSSQEMRNQMIDAYSLSTYYAGVTWYVISGGIALPIIYSGIMVLSGTLSTTTYILQCFLLPRLITIMAGLDHEYDLYHNAVSASQHVFNILNRKAQIVSGDSPLFLEANGGDLLFDEVSFSYPSNEIFKAFNLHISSNETIAFVGSTGSGKTTLIKLLLRFYDINEGQIRLDGVDIRHLALHDLRHAIGLVSQDVYLFSGTIYENLQYGRPTATFEEVIEAAKAAEALDFIQNLPDGFDTIIGERGQKLSGGQRQRLSIARTILKNPPILIMDEATSAVDNETEAAIQRSIARISRGRTTIIIAHRLSTIRHVDRIYLIRDGQVTEQGTHNELVTLDGYYAYLWKLQTGEHLLLDKPHAEMPVQVNKGENKQTKLIRYEPIRDEVGDYSPPTSSRMGS